jgi:hypothetical protein
MPLSSSVTIINDLTLTAPYPIPSTETEDQMLQDYAHEGFHTCSADLSCKLQTQTYEHAINTLILLTYFGNFTSTCKACSYRRKKITTTNLQAKQMLLAL